MLHCTSCTARGLAGGGAGLHFHVHPKMAAISRAPKPPFMSQIDSQFQSSDLEKHWKYCIELQKQWSREFLKDGTLSWAMTRFKKNSAITFVWVAEQLDGRHANDISQTYAYGVLSKLYDKQNSESMKHQNLTRGSTLLRLKQHLLALMRILKAVDEKQNLSEDLILSVHQDLMKGHIVNGTQVKGGEYRIVPASTGCHIFPDHSYIPGVMRSIVSEYNCNDCDMFERASWLLLRISSLHPFANGNGRLGRLLWCFSLLRDGLPFLPIPHNDRDKYMKCIIEDSRMLQIDTGYCPCLTTLTVVHIRETWENFINNLSLEYPIMYSTIVAFISSNGVA